jgi:hypothetical protein
MSAFSPARVHARPGRVQAGGGFMHLFREAMHELFPRVHARRAKSRVSVVAARRDAPPSPLAGAGRAIFPDA